jgi:hypothetical protein
MKRLVVLLPMVILVACSALKRMVLTESQLQELQTGYGNKHYFDLRDALQQYDNVSSVISFRHVLEMEPTGMISGTGTEWRI